MSSLADQVLPLIRTRSDLHRRSAATAHGRQMHQAVDILDAAMPTTDPAEFYSVTHRALTSAIKVIARADDSSGVVGDACRRLLALHPRAAAAATVPPKKLVDWMITFQFDGDVDYFTLDPVAYAPALGDAGVAAYRARLDAVRESLGPPPSGKGRFTAVDSHERWVLEWNDRRLAVLDRDVDAIIRTHARDRRVAAWLEDTAEAFEEIGAVDLALDWAKQATDFNLGHQSLAAADYWCRLTERHRPAEALAARVYVFRRWPNASTAAALHRSAGEQWPDYRDEVVAALSGDPRQAVLFALLTLQDPTYAWELAHTLELTDDYAWADLVDAYQRVDPLAVLPVHARLVKRDLTEADASNYRHAAARLATMRALAAGSDQAAGVDQLIADLREAHRRRPRLQREFDRAGLP